MEYVYLFALFWLVISLKSALAVTLEFFFDDEEDKEDTLLRNLKETVEECKAAIEEISAAASERFLFGLTLLTILLVLGKEVLGFLLVYAYVPLHQWQQIAFYLILLANIIYSAQFLRITFTMFRSLRESKDPDAIVSHIYSRVLLAGDDIVETAAVLGRAWAAMMLVLWVIFN
ncbi:hypothetical protein TAMA11512_19970 [Selenomonas sp. TAMA-11512]|uniref:hypothetical protein n=1 Tax=Selenomonas sp. TAMA-11512 TaxID=3095337 RepID=UPI00309392ED|nr:hypothetical protein TAMA11512_19970 [Selenomonas sp. TAMA-11512]